MEIRNLMTFIRVAELCNFTRAAEALGYTQSTVSFQIKQLEEELGCLLFERINHTVSLTAEGERLLEYAQSVHHLTEEFRENLAKEKEIAGFIHVLTPDSVCEDMILTNFEDFNKKYPKIKLKFSSADTNDMIEMLDHNEADAMITLDRHVYKGDFVIAKENRINMHFVTSPSSPLATRKKIRLEELEKYPLILTEKNTGYRRALDIEMAKHSIELLPVLEISRTDIITKLICESDRVSFLPDFVTEKFVAEGKLVYLNVTDFDAHIWKQLIYHKNKWMSEALKAFVDYVKEVEFA
ncbi:MAG: LysR family transcriptional regulator [Clostridia bacterium]|nr:LysR family transcriptional regulator [Clostridia bacterium]